MEPAGVRVARSSVAGIACHVPKVALRAKTPLLVLPVQPTRLYGKTKHASTIYCASLVHSLIILFSAANRAYPTAASASRRTAAKHAHPITS